MHSEGRGGSQEGAAKFRVNARANFFSVRIISLWNRLPASLVQVHDLIKFKSMLRTVDLSFALLGKL